MNSYSLLLRKSAALALVLSCCAASGFSADKTTWVKGDVFVGIGYGQYAVFSNDGTPKDIISNGTYPFTSTPGCAFNPDLTKLYVSNDDLSTNGQNFISVFDGNSPHTVLQTINTGGPSGFAPVSIVFNQTGGFLVGSNNAIYRYDTLGNLTRTYLPQVGSFSTGYIDLAKDQKTVFYTALDSTFSGVVKRFDISMNTQLPDFTAFQAPYSATQLRLLPPFDGSGGLLVSSGRGIVRVDGSGLIVKTYIPSGGSVTFAGPIALDPNGTSFWVGDATPSSRSPLYRLNIASGNTEIGPVCVNPGQAGVQLGGICVLSEITAGVDRIPPTVTLIKSLSGPSKMVVLGSSDNHSGLASIDVLKCSNCTATTDPFIVGTNTQVLTTAMKTDQTKSSSVQIKVADVVGNTTIFDPVDVTVESDGAPSVHVLVHVDRSEHLAVLNNGSPGIRQFILDVNGTTIPILLLKDGEVRTVDIAFAMHPGAENRVEVISRGRAGSSLSLVLTPPPQ